MKVRIITGIFSLLLLQASSAAMAETVIIDFTGTVDDVEGTSPLSIGNGMSGHIEFNTEDILPAESSINASSALFVYQGQTASVVQVQHLDGHFPPYRGHTIDVLVFDNDSGGSYAGYYDMLDIEVRDATGENFGFWIICDESEGLVDLTADEIIDFERLSALTSTPYELEFWARGALPTNQDDRWKATGPATITSSSVVPLPAAVWLFGSGLLGLIGAAKRRRALA